MYLSMLWLASEIRSKISGLLSRKPSIPMSDEALLRRQVEQELERLNFRFVKHPHAMGLYPDFLVGLDMGRIAIIEVEAGFVSNGVVMLRRLRHTVEALEADGGIMVVPEGDLDSGTAMLGWMVSDRPLAIVSWQGLAGMLASLVKKLSPAGV